jgi:hypothetical protein
MAHRAAGMKQGKLHASSITILTLKVFVSALQNFISKNSSTNYSVIFLPADKIMHSRKTSLRTQNISHQTKNNTNHADDCFAN